MYDCIYCESDDYDGQGNQFNVLIRFINLS